MDYINNKIYKIHHHSKGGKQDFFNAFETNFFSSVRLYLFNQKYSKNSEFEKTEL